MLFARYNPLAKQHQLTLRISSRDLPIEGSEILLQRILENLLINAIRYTNKGGVLICARKRGSSILLQVWDTGVGIEESRLPQLLKPFAQETKAADGVWLGLYIVQILCDRLGIHFLLRSTPGKGTCASLLIPAADNGL